MMWKLCEKNIQWSERIINLPCKLRAKRKMENNMDTIIYANEEVNNN